MANAAHARQKSGGFAGRAALAGRRQQPLKSERNLAACGGKDALGDLHPRRGLAGPVRPDPSAVNSCSRTELGVTLAGLFQVFAERHARYVAKQEHCGKRDVLFLLFRELAQVRK
jgi:hypothetical protein